MSRSLVILPQNATCSRMNFANSAALRFIHRDRLESEGYGDYAALFSEQAA